MTLKLVLFTVVLVGFVSQSLTHKTKETIVVQFNQALLQALQNIGYGPTASYRTLALVHTSMYNAWAHYDSKAVPSQVKNFNRQPASKRTSENKQTAASYAAYNTLVTLLPSEKSLFDQVMKDNGYSVQNIPTSSNTAAGVGTQASIDFIKARDNDNSNWQGNLNPSGAPYSEPILLPGYKPYQYVNTADKLNDINYWQPQINPDGTAQRIVTPQWRIVTPFALTSGSQFRPEGPYRTSEWKKFIGQARQIYDLSKSQTTKQRLIALYWDGVGFFNPIPAMNIAQHVSRRDKHSFDEDIILFLTVANALLDGSIATFDAKIYYNSVRPVTVIRKFIDSDWQPLIPTPPHPDHVAGHSANTASALQAIRLFTGSDYFGGSFTDPDTGITLRWKTFTEAVDEAGRSRMYGGIHYERAVKVGIDMGTKVGGAVWKKVQDLVAGKS